MKPISAASERFYGDERISVRRVLCAWCMDADPARLAMRHLFLLGFFLVISMLAAAVLRFEALTPAGDLVSKTTFGSLFSLHGMLMFYFVMLPAFPGVLGYASLRYLAGARSLALPRLACAAWQLLAVGGLLVTLSFVKGGTEAGWSFDAAFGGRFTALHLLTAAGGVFLASVALALMGINYLATLSRVAGLTWRELPPLAAALALTSLMAIAACPVLASCCTMILAEQLFGFPLFDPALGADPQLFRTLFWIFGTPALYMVLLPSLGIVSEILATRSGHGLAGRRHINAAFAAIAVMSLFLWGQHFLSDPGPAARVAQCLTGGVSAAIGVVIVLWLVTLYRGALRIDTPVMYALGYIVTFVAGALSGVMLSFPALNMFLHNTSFITAHVHTMAVAALGMAFLGGLHAAWPQLTGREFSQGVGRAAALVIIVGVPFAYLPLFAMGLHGMLRRQQAYPPEFQVPQVLASAGMSILLIGVLIACFNLRASRAITAPAAPDKTAA